MKEKGSAIYQIFLLALSIYVLAILTLEIFITLDPETSLVLQKIDLSICIIFMIDFFINLYTTENKLKYLKWGWIDLLSSIPMVDPLRWGRLARIVRILRFIRTIKSLKILIATIQNSKLQSLTLLVALITFVTFTSCASLIIEFEKDYANGISRSGDALWWSFLNLMNAKVSITQAQSSGGIFITVVLNKLGLLLFAYFNAIIVSWLINKRSEVKRAKIN